MFARLARWSRVAGIWVARQVADFVLTLFLNWLLLKLHR